MRSGTRNMANPLTPIIWVTYPINTRETMTSKLRTAPSGEAMSDSVLHIVKNTLHNSAMNQRGSMHKLAYVLVRINWHTCGLLHQKYQVWSGHGSEET